MKHFFSLLILYHGTKIFKARPGFDDQPEYPSVQINSSSPCFNLPRYYLKDLNSNVQCSDADANESTHFFSVSLLCAIV